MCKAHKVAAKLDERDIARKTAVVPPICLQSGNAIFVTRVIDRGDHKVITRADCRSDIAVETCEAAFALADLLFIEPEPGVVVRRAWMKEDTRALFALISEVAFVPNRTLIVEERLALGVPVGWDFEFGSFGKVIFDGKWIAGLGFLIEEPSILLFFVMKAEEA